MSVLRRLRGALAGALRAGARTIATFALAGAFAGALWALAEAPTYEATATVIYTDRGDAVAAAGSGVIGAPGPEGAARLLELARSEDVATAAATVLGNDLTGAALLATTEFQAGREDSGVVIRSQAGSADVAAAAANAFAVALVEVGATAERRRLRRADEELAEVAAELDPAGGEAAAINERRAAIEAVQALGDPLEPGAEAPLPAAGAGERSPARAGLAGGLAGVLLSLALLVGRELRRRPIRRAVEVESALGEAPLLTIDEAGRIGRGMRLTRPGVLELEDELQDSMQALFAKLALGGSGDAPATIAVTAPSSSGSSIALGLASSLAMGGGRVILVEADLRRPALAAALELAVGPGLAEYLEGGARPGDVMRAVALLQGGAEEPHVLVCVPAGHADRSAAAALGGERLPGLIDRLRRAYDFVIVDAPPVIEGPGAAVAAGATDGTVISVRSGADTAEELIAARDGLGSAALLGTVFLRDSGR